MFLSAYLLNLSAFTFNSVDIPTIGPCDVKVKTQANFDFDKFHTEEGGNWSAVYGPNTKFIRNLNNLTINITPIGNGQYRDVISYFTKDDEKGILADEVITNNGNGVCTATKTDGEVFKIHVIKYVPGRYNFYYICNKAGSDRSTDYRYVLAHGALTTEENADIRALDWEYGFKGELRSIGLRLRD